MSDTTAAVRRSVDDVLRLSLNDDVRAASGGDARAFGRLVDATSGIVASITLAILRDLEESRDVAQDVYVAAWRDLRKLHEPHSFLPWLRQIARNKALHSLRARTRRRRRFGGPSDPDALLAVAADPRPDAMARLVDEEERAALRDAIDALPDTSREVVILFYREGESVRQVAELLDLSEAAVKQRLSRARGALRESMTRRLRDTRPGAGFTAAVVTAITLAVPAGASAAGLAVGKAATSGSGWGAAAGVAAKVGGASMMGALAGVFGGWWGVLFGSRDLLRRARDERERRGILQYTAAAMLATLGFGVAIIVDPTPLTATIAFVPMFVLLSLSHFLWIPRITARRLEAERLEDRVRFERERRRRVRSAVLGCVLGFVFGGGAIVAAWIWG